MKNISEEGLEEIKALAIDVIENGSEIKGNELHYWTYGINDFISGTYKAKEWLENNYGVFEATGKISEHEHSHNGKITTDLASPYDVCNMLIYILGEELLSKSETLIKNWDTVLNEKNIKDIIEEIEKV